MTLEQLKVFVCVAHEMNVTRAAKILNLTQAAASASLATLENRYQVHLFSRVGRHLELTETGRLFLPIAEDIINRVNGARDFLKQINDPLSGSIRVIVSQTLCNFWLPRILSKFVNKYPSIKVEIETGNSQQVEKAVLEGEFAIGFSERKPHSSKISSFAIGQDKLFLAIPKKFERLSKDKLVGALVEIPWIAREKDSVLYLEAKKILGDIFSNHQLKPSVILPTNEAIREFILSTDSFALLPDEIIGRDIGDGLVCAAPIEISPRTFFCLSEKDRNLEPYYNTFVSFISNT